MMDEDHDHPMMIRAVEDLTAAVKELTIVLKARQQAEQSESESVSESEVQDIHLVPEEEEASQPVPAWRQREVDRASRPREGQPIAFRGPPMPSRPNQYIKQIVAGKKPTARAIHFEKKRQESVNQWQQQQFEAARARRRAERQRA